MRFAEELLEPPNGSHAFKVSATDTAGNVEAMPAGRTWTVDTTATRVLTSVADTKISENASRTKYGPTSFLGADDEPDNSGKDVNTLIRWDLSTKPTVSKTTDA